MTETEALGFYIYARQAATFEADPDEINRIWDDDAGIRNFWVAEAAAAIGFMDQWRTP